MKKLSIIISNRNDTVMLSITINSCIEELRPLGLENCEIVICDNSDIESYKCLKSYIPIRYIRNDLLRIHRQDFPCLFTARETAIKNARGKYICCIDSHMIIGRNMFVDLYNFMESKKDDKTLGFAHAPINWAHHHQKYAKHDRDMSNNELGDWNNKYSERKTITWKGMPWICRRDWFLSKTSGINGYGALSQHEISWGGGDMHIGIKPWLLGFKNWAVPCRAGIHIGPFPNTKHTNDNSEYKYRLYSNSGKGPCGLGFLISCYVLGGEQMMDRNKNIISERFGKYINVNNWWEKAKVYGKDEKEWIDDRKIMSFEQLLETKPWNS